MICFFFRGGCVCFCVLFGFRPINKRIRPSCTVVCILDCMANRWLVGYCSSRCCLGSSRCSIRRRRWCTHCIRCSHCTRFGNCCIGLVCCSSRPLLMGNSPCCNCKDSHSCCWLDCRCSRCRCHKRYPTDCWIHSCQADYYNYIHLKRFYTRINYTKNSEFIMNHAETKIAVFNFSWLIGFVSFPMDIKYIAWFHNKYHYMDLMLAA